MLKRYTIKTERRGLYNITSYVRQAVTESGVQEGIAVIFCPHTHTADFRYAVSIMPTPT